jgi:hypothetical protein
MADVSDGPVAIVSHTINDQGDSVGRITLIIHLFDRRTVFRITGAAGNGPFDIVFRHVVGPGVINCQPQPEISIWISTALACGDSNFAG